MQLQKKIDNIVIKNSMNVNIALLTVTDTRTLKQINQGIYKKN